MTVLSAWEVAARSFEAPQERPSRWPTPGAMARHLLRSTRQTPALDLIDEHLVRLLNEPDGRVIITMPPQEGKSKRVATDFVLWWLQQRPETRAVVASYGQGLANRNGKAIRRTITDHRELGLTIAADNGSASDWSTAQGGGVFSVGIGGGLTGRPADLMVIDDPIKDRKEADSELFRQNVWEWWTDVASARLAPGAPVVVILTRWHEDDLAGRLLADAPGEWRVLNIPAQADHDPAKGEVDILGREPGEFLESAQGRTQEQWEQRKRTAGSRSWAALYQGRPSPAAGGVLERDWWSEYQQPLWLVREDGSHIVTNADELIISWDMAFKDLDTSDYVVGQVWMRRGANVYLLDQVRGRWHFPETVKQVRKLAAKWPQALLKLVEDKANGTAVIATLTSSIVGIVPEEPVGSKEARAAAISPVVEARNAFLPAPELAPWVGDFIEEAAAFPNGAHDDQVDAATQAINRLIVLPLLAGETFDSDDLDDELADYSISAY